MTCIPIKYCINAQCCFYILARHNETVRSTFVRFEDSRLSGMDLDEPVDWRRDDDNLPAVYLLVRALVQADATDVATQD
ncbi:DUF2471 family protein [Paraburkholderia madseniana]|nr:DUF2471 family protein [Paraburkholderia sp. SECH4]MCX4173942.1 DUF2471 family protein [Paraburkholderia madseniana]